MTRLAVALAALALVAAAAGCFLDMRRGARLVPYAVDPAFPDSMSARTPPAGSVPRDSGTAFPAGFDAAGRPGADFPVPVTLALLQRGRERYDVDCSPCHDRRGQGRGIVVQRGFSAPPSFDEDRLRAAPPGHFVDVMTHGYGAMYAYADRVTPADRWAIAAYVRALQLSHRAPVAALTPAERARLATAGGSRGVARR